MFRQAKVPNLNFFSLVIGKHKVFDLDVAVGHVAIVEVLDAVGHLGDDVAGVFLGEMCLRNRSMRFCTQTRKCGIPASRDAQRDRRRASVP